MAPHVPSVRRTRVVALGDAIRAELQQAALLARFIAHRLGKPSIDGIALTIFVLGVTAVAEVWA